jgi:glycerol-3-phosphate cytidylyltransferase-like family protein
VLVFVELDPPRRRELLMLAEAAKLGTYVVAVLSTDELLRAENGSTPQLTLEERCEIAASLRHVDAVAACGTDGDRAAQARIHRAQIALVDPHVRERFARVISGCEIVALL